MRLKEHIEEIQNPLDKLLQLRGVTFKWRTDIEQPTKHEQIDDIGVIAQEVETQFPQAVTTDSNGYKSVNYPSLVAPLIEAVKELYSKLLGHDEQLEQQSRQIASIDEKKVNKIEFEKLQKENAELKARLDRLEKALSAK